MAKLKTSRHWFLIAATLLLFAPIVCLIVGLAFPSLVRPLPGNGLRGVTVAPVKPALNLHSWFDGKLQARIAYSVVKHFGPPREYLVRLNDGLFYFLFHQSQVKTVMVGRQRELYENWYWQDWCERLVDLDATSLTKRLEQAEALTRQSGKAFVFLISPSKAAIYPEFLPQDFCRPPNTPRPYDELIKVLKTSRVSFIDGHQLTLLARQQQAYPVFPRDGTHWSSLGALPTTRALIAELSRQLDRPLPQIELRKVEVDRWPVGRDNDLAGLLNLPVRMPVYPTTHPSFALSGTPKPLSLVFVGSSFLYTPLEELSETKAVDHATFYYYFRHRYDYGTVNTSYADNTNSFEDSVKSADGIVIEANEINLVAPYLPIALDRLTAALAAARPEDSQR